MGGHGGLNILPQKRWNVYNRDNREKVERDQEALRRARQRMQRNHTSASLSKNIQKIRNNVHDLKTQSMSHHQPQNKEEDKQQDEAIMQPNPHKKVKLFKEENELYEQLKREEKKNDKEKETFIKDQLMNEINMSQHVNLFKREEIDQKLAIASLSSEQNIFTNPNANQENLGEMLKDRQNPWYSKKIQTDYQKYISHPNTFRQLPSNVRKPYIRRPPKPLPSNTLFVEELEKSNTFFQVLKDPTQLSKLTTKSKEDEEAVKEKKNEKKHRHHHHHGKKKYHEHKKGKDKKKSKKHSKDEIKRENLERLREERIAREKEEQKRIERLLKKEEKTNEKCRTINEF